MKIRKIVIIIFAVIAAWFGLKIIGLKFYSNPTSSMENTIPKETTIMVWRMNFKPSRFEIIVYRNPERDTVTIPYSPTSYYSMIRSMDRRVFDSKYQKSFIPLNKRERWIGRCVGLPGDILQIIDSKLIVNGEIYQNPDLKKSYILKTKDSKKINPDIFDNYGIKPEEISDMGNMLIINLTQNQADTLRKLNATESLSPIITDKNTFDPNIFPFSSSNNWSIDNYGELTIPKKGIEIKLDTGNLPIYRRLIMVYEQNDLRVVNNDIMINGEKTDTYIPKMDYYFIICDNRDNSNDSRYWGFLPENHICGKVLKIFK